MSKYSIVKYRMMQWAFKWVCDEDGDVGLQVVGIVTFITYKDGTIIHWGGEFRPAGKVAGIRSEDVRSTQRGFRVHHGAGRLGSSELIKFVRVGRDLIVEFHFRKTHKRWNYIRGEFFTFHTTEA